MNNSAVRDCSNLSNANLNFRVVKVLRETLCKVAASGSLRLNQIAVIHRESQESRILRFEWENISGKLWSMERSGNLGQVHNGILTGENVNLFGPATYALWQQNSHILTFSKVKFNLSTTAVIIFRSGPNSIVV